MYKPSDFTFDKKAKTVTFLLKDGISPFTYKKLEIKDGNVVFLGKSYDVTKPITINIDKIEKTYQIVPIVQKFDKNNKQINPVSNKTFESDLNDPKSYLSRYLEKCPEDRTIFENQPIEFVPLRSIPKSSHGRLYIAGAIGLTALVVAANVIPGVGEVVDVAAAPEVVALDAGIGATEGAAAITEGATVTAEAGESVAATAEEGETAAKEGESVAESNTEESKVLETESKPGFIESIKNRFGLGNGGERFIKSANEIKNNPIKAGKQIATGVGAAGASAAAIEGVKNTITGTNDTKTGAGYKISIQFCLLICIIVIILIFVIYIVHKYNNLTSI
jgi:hypothetical protein